LAVSRSIDDITNLTDFGLDKPSFSLEIKETNGTSLKAVIGKKTVTGDSYYVLPAGATHAVLVQGTSLDTLLGLPAAPPFATPTAVVTAEPLPTLPLPAATPTP
jgi:hypothetical protein